MKKNDHSNLSNFAEEAMRKTNHFKSFLGIQPESDLPPLSGPS